MGHLGINGATLAEVDAGGVLGETGRPFGERSAAALTFANSNGVG
jgi:hypothetical protein